MPLGVPNTGSDPSQADTGLSLFGVPSPPPPPPVAPPTLNSAPVVSSTPGAGQGVALDTGGKLPTSAPATAVVMVTADPASPKVGQVWYRTDTSQLCIQHNATTVKRSAAFT